MDKIAKHLKLNNKKTLYIDMDGCLVNFQSGIDALPLDVQIEYHGRLDEVEGIFGLMKPNEGAVEAYNELDKHFNVYILSTSPWDNISAASDKIAWVKKYLPNAFKNVILSHNKHLNIGEYLIDDRILSNGVNLFKGEVVHYGSNDLPNWKSVVEYLIPKA